MRRLLAWLWSSLWASGPSGARLHPDGGPGPHSGSYPWEKDGEALPADPMVAVVTNRHGDEVMLVGSAVAMAADIPLVRTEADEAAVQQLLSPPHLLPGDAGYWEQFA